MSLILDALKRAERERNADAVPAPGDVAAPVAGGAPPPARRKRLAVAIVVGVIVVGALGWEALRGGKTRAPAEIAPSQVQVQAPPPPIMARPAPPETQAYVPPVIPGTESVASLDDLTDEQMEEAAPAPVTPADAPEPAPEPEPVQDPQPRQPQAATKAAEPAVAEPAPPEAATSPPSEIPPALTQPAPLRKFREMPPDYRADFPALKVEIHVYEKAVAQRFVMVNGRRYRQGERLSEGPQLVEIVPEGMVLEFRGEKLLYPLGR